MVTKFDIGEDVIVCGHVTKIETDTCGTKYTVMLNSGDSIKFFYEKYISKVNNSFPCNLGDKFYFIDVYKEIYEDICTGFQQLSDSLYVHGKQGGLFYVGNVYFDKEEAEDALKNGKVH